MPEFVPISPPVYITDADGDAYPVIGWWSDGNAWAHIHPVVGNPDGPGVGPWFHFHGEDPWYAA